MPKTIIQIKTYMCPLGLGNPDAECRFHRSIDNLPEDKKCPVHGLELVETVDSRDRMTVTIIGEEEINDFRKHGGQIMNMSLADQIDQEEISTAQKENRSPRLKERSLLTNAERKTLIDKIRSDIVKYRAIEA